MATGTVMSWMKSNAWLRAGTFLCLSILLSAGSCYKDEDGDGDPDPPRISSQPENVTVLDGDTATFRVSAQDSQGGPLTYQWQRNGADIAGATSSTLVLPNRTLADNGTEFRVVVTENAGLGIALTTNSATVQLTVRPRPVQITQQPIDRTVLEGSPATFVVFAEGSQPLSYQWQRNGADIQGATNSSFTIPAAASADAGAYRCIVSNAAGPMASLAAQLTVEPAQVPVAPAITSHPQNQAVAEGQTATFSVTATGTAPLQYQWFRNSMVINGATSPSFTTSATVLADDGSRMRVRVSNVAGSVDSNEATLSVTTTQPPASARALVGQVGIAVNNILLFADLGIPGTSRRLVLADSAGTQPLTTLEQAGIWGSFVDHSTGTFLRFDLNAGRRDNFQVGAQMYYRNNELAIVDNLTEAGGSARRWTNAETFEICGGPGGAQQRTAQDYADPRRSYMFFTVPGTNDNCFMTDNVEWAAARVDAVENTPLMRIGGEPLAARYLPNGEIGGYIQRVGTGTFPQIGDQIRYVDRNFQNPVNLFRFANVFTLGTAGDTAPGAWIFTDGNRVMSYALDGSETMPRELIPASAGTTVSASLLPGERTTPGAVGVLGFAFLLTGDEQFLVPVRDDFTVNRAGKFVLGAANPFNDYDQTDSHVIAYGTLPKRFQSLAKEGGTSATPAMTIETLPADVSIVPVQPFPPRFAVGSHVDAPQFFATAGQRFWWQTARNAAGTPSRVCSMRGDGTDRRCIDGARIAKWAAQPQLGFNDRVQAHTLYIAENEDPVAGFSGSPVRAYDGFTASVRFELGTLPGAANVQVLDATVAPLQFGMPGLITIGLPGDERRVLRFKSDQPGLTLMSD